eukprot:88558-Pleurochrysis_carterae.AAC.1
MPSPPPLQVLAPAAKRTEREGALKVERRRQTPQPSVASTHRHRPPLANDHRQELASPVRGREEDLKLRLRTTRAKATSRLAVRSCG